MKFITEQIETELSSTILEENGERQLYIEGIMAQADIKNGNGRVYPVSVLAEAVNKYMQNDVIKRTAIGELNHPASPVPNPERASHLITELYQDGSNFIGKARVLNTPMGQIVKGLHEGGVQIQVSTRGLGNIKKSVVEAYRMTAIDVVQNASAPDAFVNGIMEGVDYFWKDDQIVESSIEAKQMIEIAFKKKGKFREELAVEAFSKFMESIKAK